MEENKYENMGEALAFYVSPIDKVTVYRLARIQSAKKADGEGRMFNKDGLCKPFVGPTHMYRGCWAEVTHPSGLVVLTAEDWTAKREHRRQLRCFSQAEKTALLVLRGAHAVPSEEIHRALVTLGLGGYVESNHVINNLILKGHVRKVAGRALYVYSVNREWVHRPAMLEYDDTEIEWEAWTNGTPARSNPLYSGTEWWAVVDWPKFRGGRPPAPRREG